MKAIKQAIWLVKAIRSLFPARKTVKQAIREARLATGGRYLSHADRGDHVKVWLMVGRREVHWTVAR